MGEPDTNIAAPSATVPTKRAIRGVCDADLAYMGAPPSGVVGCKIIAYPKDCRPNVLAQTQLRALRGCRLLANGPRRELNPV
jgi:hypothetical protein